MKTILISFIALITVIGTLLYFAVNELNSMSRTVQVSR
jgi:hypothetical protein